MSLIRFLRSAAVTFGRRCDDVAYLFDLVKWLRRQRKLTRSKFPWYCMD